MIETIRKALDAIPDGNRQNEWMIDVYRKLHGLDFKGLAKQAHDAVSPKVRREKRLAKFNTAFQEAFDAEFRELVPEIEEALEKSNYLEYLLSPDNMRYFLHETDKVCNKYNSIAEDTSRIKYHAGPAA